MLRQSERLESMIEE
jgi:hypothetical protein